MARTEIEDADREEIARFIEARWHSTLVMSQGRSFYPHLEDGFIERRDDEIAGLLTYNIDNDSMQILTLDSKLERAGIGSSLMLNAIDKARTRKCTNVWLTTTNDNLRAISFYQRLGFRMTTINLGAIDEARKVKPQIPEVGERGVSIHDEILMELPVHPFLESHE